MGRCMQACSHWPYLVSSSWSLGCLILVNWFITVMHCLVGMRLITFAATGWPRLWLAMVHTWKWCSVSCIPMHMVHVLLQPEYSGPLVLFWSVCCWLTLVAYRHTVQGSE